MSTTCFHYLRPALFLLLIGTCLVESLEFVIGDFKLPSPRQSMPIVYDGANSIYIMGGSVNVSAGEYSPEVVKYDLTKKTMETVGTMEKVIQGSSVWAGNETILYFGGLSKNENYRESKEIWSFRTDGTREWKVVGNMGMHCTFYCRYSSSVWDQGEYTYIFLGSYNSPQANAILRFSSATNLLTKVGEMPSMRYAGSAVWDNSTGSAYFFGGHNGSGGRFTDILKFNPISGNVSTLNATLPVGYYSDHCAVWTGTDAYLTGAWPVRNSKATLFNPSRNEAETLNIKNYPEIRNHGCAYVEKENRIYMMGGIVNDTLTDSVMYIDLGTGTNLPDCCDHQQGTRLSDPNYCERYYQCDYNRVPIIHYCPNGLHFNPSIGECDIPERVACQ